MEILKKTDILQEDDYEIPIQHHLQLLSENEICIEIPVLRIYVSMTEQHDSVVTRTKIDKENLDSYRGFFAIVNQKYAYSHKNYQKFDKYDSGGYNYSIFYYLSLFV